MKNWRGGVTLEDLEQAAFLALMDSVNGYDSEAGPFITYYAVRLKRAFCEAYGVRTSRRDALDYADSLDAVLPGTDDLLLVDTVSDPAAEAALADVEDDIWRQQLPDALEKAPSGLPGEKQAALRQVYYDGLTYSGAAQTSGRKASDIRRITGHGLTRLRRYAVRKELEGFIERQTNYFLHVGPERSQRTHESSTEGLVIRREALRERVEERRGVVE